MPGQSALTGLGRLDICNIMLTETAVHCHKHTLEPQTEGAHLRWGRTDSCRGALLALEGSIAECLSREDASNCLQEPSTRWGSAAAWVGIQVKSGSLEPAGPASPPLAAPMSGLRPDI